MVAEQLLQTPFYLDWRFWSAVVAFLALVLSQLPPLHILFRRAKLDAEAHSQMHITHKIGNPHAQLHLILNNTGGRELRIRAIELHFKRGNEDNFVLPAKNYFQLPGDKETVLFTSFKLKPGEEWAHIVNFFNLFSRQEDKLYRQLESNLRQDIVAKREVLEDKDEMVSADDANVAPLFSFFEKKFRWLPGEYDMMLRVQTEPPDTMPSKHFRITLFESDAKELEDYRNDYRYGFGVSLNSARHVGVLVPLSEA
jgi:hypothetical protein